MSYGFGAPEETVAADRARVAAEGRGAQLLALQETDGTCAGVAFNQRLNSTMQVLTLLGSPASIRRATTRRGRWDWCATT